MVEFYSYPMHDPGLREVQRPARVCMCKGTSVLPSLLNCCCWRQRPPAVRRSRLRAAPPPDACLPESPWCRLCGCRTKGLPMAKGVMVTRAAGWPRARPGKLNLSTAGFCFRSSTSSATGLNPSCFCRAFRMRRGALNKIAAGVPMSHAPQPRLPRAATAGATMVRDLATWRRTWLK